MICVRVSPLVFERRFCCEKSEPPRTRKKTRRVFALSMCFAVKKVIMQIGETLYVTDRDDFRKWLIANHQTKKEIWLIRYKKATKKPSINYVEAVEEAICFGWIDNIEKGMDAERYATRFSPRKPKSNWTNTNKERARRMIAEGRMTPAGRASLPPDVVIKSNKR